MAFSKRRKQAESIRDSDAGRPCLKCRQKCPGFLSHSWRKICRHCKCARSEHDIIGDDHERFVEKMIFDYYKTNGLTDFNVNPAIGDYAWTPPALSARQIESYFDCLPKENVPILNSVGDRYRIQQLFYQHPPHDYDPKYSHRLSEEEKKKHRLFVALRRKDAFGQAAVRAIGPRMNGHECAECGELLSQGELGIFASRAILEGLVWHPECFVCCVCVNGLVDLIYYFKDGEVYCGRHHADSLKPRCSACDEIIFTEECIQAHGRIWHTDHFVCYECECRLGSRSQYIMRDGQPYCCRCFKSLYAVYCESCGEMIEVNDGQMVHNDMHWHASDECFSCSECSHSLLGKTFLPKHGKLYCSVACFKISRMPNEEYEDPEDSFVEYGDHNVQSRNQNYNLSNDIVGEAKGLSDTTLTSSNAYRYRSGNDVSQKHLHHHVQDFANTSGSIPELTSGVSSNLVYANDQRIDSYQLFRNKSSESSKNSHRHSRIRPGCSESNQHLSEIKSRQKPDGMIGSSSNESLTDNVMFNSNSKAELQRNKSQNKTYLLDNDSRREKKVRIVDEAVDKSKCLVM